MNEIIIGTDKRGTDSRPVVPPAELDRPRRTRCPHRTTEDDGTVAVDNIELGAYEEVRASDLLEVVPRRDNTVLGAPTKRTPSTMGNAAYDRSLETTAVSTCLSTATYNRNHAGFPILAEGLVDSLVMSSVAPEPIPPPIRKPKPTRNRALRLASTEELSEANRDDLRGLALEMRESFKAVMAEFREVHKKLDAIIAEKKPRKRASRRPEPPVGQG